jgi:hypothetical protein
VAIGNAQSYCRLWSIDGVYKPDWLKVLAWAACIPGAWLVIGFIVWKACHSFGA